MAGRFDIQIEQGADFTLPLALRHSDNTAYDLTPYTGIGNGGRGQIRRYHRSTTSIINFHVAILTPATNGQLVVTLTAVETASIPAGEQITDTRSKYVYDLELYTSGGAVKRILDGYAFVSPEVTR